MLSLDRHDRRLALAALLIGVGVVLVSLLSHGGDIAGLVKFGSGGHVVDRTAHVEELLGRDVATVDELGHDGSMYFLQAVDPFFLEPDEHAVHLDRPVYRAQRMLFPTIAGLGGLVPPEPLLWTMALTNVLAIALGTVGTSRLARRLGGSPWFGLAFALNPGILFEFDITGAGILAFAAAIWGTIALEDDRPRTAAAWFTAAVLAREVMFLYLAGVLLLRLWRTRRIPWLVGAAPSIAAGGWALYIRTRLESHPGVEEVQEFGVPFQGMIGASENWFANPNEMAVLAGVLLVIPIFVLKVVRRPSYLDAGALGFVVLALLLSRQVWWQFVDITRALAPIFTAYIVTAFARPAENDDGEPAAVSESPDTPRAVVASG